MNDDPMYDRDRDPDQGYDPDFDPDQDPRSAGNQGRRQSQESWGNLPDDDYDVNEGQRRKGQGVDQDIDSDLDDTYDQ